MKTNSFKYRVNPRFLHLWRVTHIVCIDVISFTDRSTGRYDKPVSKITTGDLRRDELFLSLPGMKPGEIIQSG